MLPGSIGTNIPPNPPAIMESVPLLEHSQPAVPLDFRAQSRMQNW